MLDNKKKICIVGIGGQGRETLLCVIDSIGRQKLKIQDVACFMVEDKNLIQKNIMGVEVIPESKFDPKLYNVVVAIGDPTVRKKVIKKLPSKTTFKTIIHPNAIVSDSVDIGEGSIISAGVVMTHNIKIGKHSLVNLNSTISHDCIIGDYFTTGPGVNISGTCVFGNKVYFGTNSSVRQEIKICDNVVIGMGSVVIDDISKEGVYIGNPAKKLLKKRNK